MLLAPTVGTTVVLQPGMPACLKFVASRGWLALDGPGFWHAVPPSNCQCPEQQSGPNPLVIRSPGCPSSENRRGFGLRARVGEAVIGWGHNWGVARRVGWFTGVSACPDAQLTNRGSQKSGNTATRTLTHQ
jgi:hypothetical protein